MKGERDREVVVERATVLAGPAEQEDDPERSTAPRKTMGE